MRSQKNGKQEDELNFWQPTSDLMSALLYILMLVIVLLGLYLMYMPEYDQPYEDPGDSYAGGDWGSASPSPEPTPTFFWDGGWGGGWGGGGDAPTPTPTLTPSPTPTVSPTPGPAGAGNGNGIGPGYTPDPGTKSAVYVMMIDGETERTIKEEDVEFELYDADGAIQILNVYYPKRITYRSYLTTESGTFFFPEKLASATYEVHDMTAPEGYDIADNTTFILDDEYDWPDPFVVRVPLYPSRNVIRVQMNDASTGMAVAGGSFDIVATEDVITGDGTLRYQANQTVGVLECDESGYGESDLIYLGKYTLRQRDIPFAYADHPDDIEVEVKKKSTVLSPLNSVDNERTTIRLSVLDELTGHGIQGAVINIRPSEGDAFTVTTDYNGTALLDQLEKEITYRISQTQSDDNYQLDHHEYTVNVTASGRIDQKAEKEVILTNRLIRVALGITDEFSNIQIPGRSLSLYDQNDELIRSWTTSGSAQVFTDLQPGTYYLILGDDQESKYPVTVRDQAALQELNIHSTYTMQYIVFGAIGLIAILLIIVLILTLRRRRHR